MSALPDDVIVADKLSSTLQSKEDDPNTLVISSELSAHGNVIDDTTSSAEDVPASARRVPEASDNDDSELTTVSDGTLTAETYVDVLNVTKVVNDGEPEAPLQHTSHSDNENIDIIQHSELSVNDEIESRFVGAFEQPTTFVVSTNVQPVTFAEPTQEDVNEVASAAVSEIRKDELPSIDDQEAQTPSLDADATNVNGPASASVKDGEPLIGISIGPEGGVSGALEPSINGVGSTTDAEPSSSLETPIHDPNAQMNRSAELLEGVIVPTLEAPEIFSTAVEPAVIEDTTEPSQGETNQMEVEVSHASELAVVTELTTSAALSTDVAFEDTPIPIEAEPACIEAHSSSGEPETSEAPMEETVALTEPELEPILQPTTEAVESEPAEESATTVEIPIVDLAKDITAVASATITAAEPAVEFVTPVVVDETAIEEDIEALGQPVTSSELEVDVSVPEVVSAPVEAAIEPVVIPAQSKEDTITAHMEPEVLTGTPAAAEERPVAADDSIAVEPMQTAVSDSEPATPTETSPIAVAEPEDAVMVPEIPAVVEPEPVELEVEESVVETIPIDVEPPSCNASFVVDPEVGFGVPDKEPQTSVYEETVTFVSDEPALESTEESKLQEVVAFEERSVDETSVVEDVVPVDIFAPTRETASAEETAPIVEPVLDGTAQIEETVTAPTGEPEVVDDIAPVEEIAPTEDVTSIGSTELVESTPPVEEVIDASEFIVDTAATYVEELEVPVVQETLTSVAVTNGEQPPHNVEEAALATEEILVSVGDISTAEEQPSPAVVVVATSVEEDIPIAEELSASAPTEEDTPAFEEHSAPAPVEEDILTAEEHSAPAPVEEDILTAEELSAPTPVEVDIPAIEGLPVPGPLEDIIPVDENPPLPAPIEDVIPVVEEFPTPAPVEDVIPAVEDSPAPAPVEDVFLALEDPLVSAPIVEVDAIVEEPPVPPVVEELPISAPVEGVSEEPSSSTEESLESIIVEGEEYTRVAVEETPLPEEQPEVAEQTSTPIAEYDAADELVLEATPVTEDPPAPEEGPSAVDVLPTPAELAFVPEHTPVPEAIPVTPADSMLATSSIEENVVISTELVECDLPIAEQSVLVEEPAPAGSETSAFETVVTEVLCPTVELTEEALVADVETDEESSHAEVPASLTGQLADETTKEESPEVPISEELVTEAPAEPAILDEELVGVSPVQIAEEPADANIIHPETNESVKDSEPSAVMAEAFSEIEEVAEEQEIATITALSVVTEIERPKSPWTPSYSVTTQGPGVIVEEPVSSDEEEDDTFSIHPRTPEIIVDEAAAIIPEIAINVAVDTQSQGDTDVVVTAEEVVLGEVEEVRPKSPWTPSYSVTVQGNVTESNEALDDDLEQLLPGAAHPVEAEVEELPISFTQETLVTGEVSSSTEVMVDVHTLLSETPYDTVELVIPDPATEAEVPQHDSPEQVITTVEAEPSAVVSPEPATLEEEPEEIELGSFIVEDESSHLDPTEPAEEHNRSLWTSSYSVTGLESATASEDEAVTNDDEFVEHGSFIIEDPPTAIVAKPELLTPVDNPVGERPKSPWTPSYSVTKQGPNEEAQELDKLEQLPGPVASIPELATDEVPIPPVLITETRASVDGYVTAEVAQETPQAFPILEGSQKISKMPSLSVVDELNAANDTTDVTGSTALRIDIPATNDDGRKRLESTTSSRFFPGGWFSSSPKVPEEGRASLDVATGEFVSQSSVENTPTTALPSAVEEDREKKSRWCTIM